MSKNKLSKLIEKHQSRIEDEVRDYIGASSIGSECLRQIWYQFKGVKAKSVTPRVKRIWDVGKKLENLVLDWLESAGIEINRLWYDLVERDIPCFKGHLDSVWTKEGIAFAIIEVKTAKDSSFKQFVKHGLKKWDAQYYAQVQTYMGMSGIHITYIIVLNKDNSDISDEMIIFDPDFYEALKNKARLIYDAKIPPPKIHHSPAWYQCKMCKFNKVCHI